MKMTKMGLSRMVVVALVVGTMFLGSCTCKKDLPMYEAIPVGVIAADVDGKIVNANKPLQDMLGYALEELKGLTWQQITPPKWHAMESEMIKLAMEQPYAVYQKAYLKKDGTALPIQIIGWVNKDKDGVMIGSGGIIWPLVSEFSSAMEPAAPSVDAAATPTETTETVPKEE